MLTKPVVILGGGYGGLNTALDLEKRFQRNDLQDFPICLIDRRPHHELIIRLHEVAAGTLPEEKSAIPFREILRGKKISFLQEEVQGIDPLQKKIFHSGGELEYSYAVIALGSITAIPQALRKAPLLELKSLGEALVIKDSLRTLLKRAIQLPPGPERGRNTTVAIVGGGFTGTELASEIADGVQPLLRQWGVAPEEFRLLLIEATGRLLPGFDPQHAQYALRCLRTKGVEVHLYSPVKEIVHHSLYLERGEVIPAGLIIWVTGVRGPHYLEEWGLPTGPGGRVRVNQFLEVEGYPGLYCIGDASLVLHPMRQIPIPPSAQLALAQAERVAYNIFAEIVGLPRVPFRFYSPGEIVSLGLQDGIASLIGFSIYGPKARQMKNLLYHQYLLRLGGWRLVRQFGADPKVPEGVWETYRMGKE